MGGWVETPVGKIQLDFEAFTNAIVFPGIIKEGTVYQCPYSKIPLADIQDLTSLFVVDKHRALCVISQNFNYN